MDEKWDLINGWKIGKMLLKIFKNGLPASSSEITIFAAPETSGKVWKKRLAISRPFHFISQPLLPSLKLDEAKALGKQAQAVLQHIYFEIGENIKAIFMKELTEDLLENKSTRPIGQAELGTNSSAHVSPISSPAFQSVVNFCSIEMHMHMSPHFSFCIDLLQQANIRP